MAKKKKKTKAAEEAPKLSKKEIKAYYKEHGWRATISKFGIAPKDLSPIVGGGDGPKKPAKKKKKKGVDGAGDAPKKKGRKKTAKSPEAPYGYKKDGTPRKPPGRKAGSTAGDAAPKKAKSAPKKRGRPPGRPKATATATKVPASSSNEAVLDWLLAYRNKNQKAGHMIPLDSVIIDLTMKVRK
jgi:hypothetical protein